MASIPLRRLGHNLTILERSPIPLLHNQGAGVVAGGETQAFFRRHDHSERPIAVSSRQRLYLNRNGEIIDWEDSVQRMTSWDLLYYLSRANFDGVENEYLQGKGLPVREDGEGLGKYEYGHKVTGLIEVGVKIEVAFDYVRDNGEQPPDSGNEHTTSASILADLVIAADGPSSSLRRLLLPSAPTRIYAGYVAFRGTVVESELSANTVDVFVEKFSFFHSADTQILAYTIPGAAGSLDRGMRLVNWVWYRNYEQSSKDYKELMTDVDGNQHHLTLPTDGKMQPEIWAKQKQRARDTLPPQFAEIVTKTTKPFVQAITDHPPVSEDTKFGRLLNGKVVLVGDALCGFRPHTAASTSQAAYHALLLEKVFKGEMTWDEWEHQVLEYARVWFKRGVILGNRSQFGTHPLQDGSQC